MKLYVTLVQKGHGIIIEDVFMGMLGIAYPGAIHTGWHPDPQEVDASTSCLFQPGDKAFDRKLAKIKSQFVKFGRHPAGGVHMLSHSSNTAAFPWLRLLLNLTFRFVLFFPQRLNHQEHLLDGLEIDAA